MDGFHEWVGAWVGRERFAHGFCVWDGGCVSRGDGFG